jgi:hypothetical protein
VVSDLDWQLWIAQDGGWPVRLLATSTVDTDADLLDEFSLEPPTAWELRVEVSRPNDPTLTVVAPKNKR